MKERPGIDSVLGKSTVNYVSNYSPAILARESRVPNRLGIGIDSTLPFVGADAWHCHECSFLTTSGLPVNGVLKLVVPCASPYIVESKSLKLYLFSFNNEKLGTGTQASAISEFLTRVQADLSELLQEDGISGSFFQNGEEFAHSSFAAAEPLSSLVSLEELKFDTYQETPKLLQEGMFRKFFISSDLLRSNCKITNQPDWGDVFIYYKGSPGVSLESVARYLVSFRNENHFHEEIVETIFSRIHKRFNPGRLAVTALYTRRGGIDICPTRSIHAEDLPSAVIDSAVWDWKTIRQ